MLLNLLEKKSLNEEELEYIQLHEDVESCEFVGLEHGHGGDYLYHVKMVGDTNLFSVTTPRSTAN